MIDDILSYVHCHTKEQLSFLRELVLQPSYSGRKEDVDKVGRLISRELATLPMKREVVTSRETGDHLLFRSPASVSGASTILLVGHMDTVFPPESGFDSFRDDGDKVYGPGVIDMKGGLAVAVYALKSLHHLGLLEKIPVTLLCNSDEEIGSPTSHDLILSEAKRALWGMVFECGGLAGEIVTGRKGKSGFTLQVQGKSGHAAFAGSKKASAIVALAHKILEIEQLNDAQKQLVVNVGTVQGGIGPNTIAEHAAARIDTRYLKREDGEYCENAMQQITSRCHLLDTEGTLTRTSGRKPMEQSPGNRKLYHVIKETASRLGIAVQEELRSGVSDANTMAGSGLAVVDGMGPIGDCDHSDREYMVKRSLPEKTMLAATTLAQMQC